MRRTMIVALAVLALCAGICAAGHFAVEAAVREADGLRLETARLAATGRTGEARATARRLAERWQARAAVLETLTSHDALSEVTGGIADAMICLDAGDRLEFSRAIAAIGIALERIRVAEAVRWENLY